jgi:putative NADH-flavin reductase
MEKELIELIAKFANLEKRLEEVEKRKIHCDDSRSKIYDRIAILEQDKVRTEEKFKIVFEKLDVIIQTLKGIASNKDKLVYDVFKILFGTVTGAIITWFIAGRLN